MSNPVSKSCLPRPSTTYEQEHCARNSPKVKVPFMGPHFLQTHRRLLCASEISESHTTEKPLLCELEIVWDCLDSSFPCARELGAVEAHGHVDALEEPERVSIGDRSFAGGES